MDRGGRERAGQHALRPISSRSAARAVVADGVDGVEAQAVEMEFLEPVERVLDEEVAHLPRAAKLIAAPHGVLMSLGEELRRVGGGSFRRGRSGCRRRRGRPSGRAHGPRRSALQVLGPAVAGIGRKRQHAVIAPVRRPGKSATGISSIAVTPRLAKRSSGRARRGISSLGEGADVQLVEHGLLPGPARQLVVHHRRAGRSPRSGHARPAAGSARRVGHLEPIRQREAVKARRRPPRPRPAHATPRQCCAWGGGDPPVRGTARFAHARAPKGESAPRLLGPGSSAPCRRRKQRRLSPAPELSPVIACPCGKSPAWAASGRGAESGPVTW